MPNDADVLDPVVQKLLAELLRRIESGRTTSADARFLRAFLSDVLRNRGAA